MQRRAGHALERRSDPVLSCPGSCLAVPAAHTCKWNGCSEPAHAEEDGTAIDVTARRGAYPFIPVLAHPGRALRRGPRPDRVIWTRIKAAAYYYGSRQRPSHVTN